MDKTATNTNYGASFFYPSSSFTPELIDCVQGPIDLQQEALVGSLPLGFGDVLNDI